MTFDHKEAPTLNHHDLWGYHVLKQLETEDLGNIDDERLIELVESAFEERIKMSSDGWTKVSDFILGNDEKIFMFVLNQLRKKLGNRPPIPKPVKN